jgi:hypothetical protein
MPARQAPRTPFAAPGETNSHLAAEMDGGAWRYLRHWRATR